MEFSIEKISLVSQTYFGHWGTIFLRIIAKKKLPTNGSEKILILKKNDPRPRAKDPGNNKSFTFSPRGVKKNKLLTFKITQGWVKWQKSDK